MISYSYYESNTIQEFNSKFQSFGDSNIPKFQSFEASKCRSFTFSNFQKCAEHTTFNISRFQLSQNIISENDLGIFLELISVT